MRRAGWALLLVLLLVAGYGNAARAQQPTATPDLSASSDPVAVVRAYFEAINRGDAAAAAALLTDTPVFVAVLFCQQGCNSRTEIEAGLDRIWLPNLPVTVAYEQVSPSVVIARAQGSGNRADNSYFTVRFEVRGDRIAAYQGEAAAGCIYLTQPNTICAPYPPPLRLPVGGTYGPGEAPSVTTMPLQLDAPTTVGGSAVPVWVVLSVLGLAGLTVTSVVVASVVSGSTWIIRRQRPRDT